MARVTQPVFLFAMIIGAVPWTGRGLAQRVGESVVMREATDDLYAAGGQVEVLAPVNGDAVLAGATVSVSGDVRDDLIAAGGDVSFSGRVGDDARLAGGSVNLTGAVTGHAVMAGGEVHVGAGSSIGEWAWLAGGQVIMAGSVGGELKVMAGTVELRGQVNGNAELAGEEIRIADGTVINGDLTWRSNSEPEISQGAVIKGEVRQGEPLPESRGETGFLESLFVLISLIVAAGALYTLMRPACEACVAAFQARPWVGLWVGLLTGLAVFAVTPAVIVLLFVTGIGWLLGLVLLAAYGLGLLLGGLTGLVLVGRQALAWVSPDPEPSLAKTWLAIAAAALVLSLLYLIRPIGILAGTLLLFLGLGAIAREAYTALRAERRTSSITVS
jgi:cytoskeletal protein CcmA (bactofilin family)